MMRFAILASSALAGAAKGTGPGAVAKVLGDVPVEDLLGKTPSPDGLCIVQHCGVQLGKCGLDGDCRSALVCIQGCGMDNQACLFQCNSDYENEVYDSLVHCMFTENHCMPGGDKFDVWQMCREAAVPITHHRGAELTKEGARRMLTRGSHRGDWMVSKGLSHAYDCFDCQYNSFGDHGNGTTDQWAAYKIHKSSGGTRWNQAARFFVQSFNYGGLHHHEDWRILAADETSDTPAWLTFYYCGAAPDAQMAYEGSTVITPDGTMPTDPKVVAQIEAVLARANITLACVPDNSKCEGHPSDPFPATNRLDSSIVV